jgi:hypothetical protein
MKNSGRWLRLYGGPAWSLLILLGCLAVTGYVAEKILSGPMALRIFVWFAAAAVLHDFVLFPAYSAIDRLVSATQRKPDSGRQPVINYFRIPAALSLLLLLIYLPTILGRGSATFHAASGLGQTNVFLRWILLSLSFFAVSGAVFAARLLRFRHSTKERL